MPQAPEIHITSAATEQQTVVLKPVTEQELIDSHLWDTVPSATTNLPEADRQVLASPKDAIEKVAGEEGYVWGVHVLGESALKLVGVTGLWQPDSPYPGTATFILDPSARGKGVGTLSKAGLLTYAFDHLDKKGVQSETLDVNEASKKSLEKSGFVQKRSNRPEPVSYGTDGETSATTQWMAFNPEGPDYSDAAFGALGKDKIAGSRAKVAETLSAVKVDVQEPLR